MKPEKVSHVEIRRAAAAAVARMHGALLVRVHLNHRTMSAEAWAAATQEYDAMSGAALRALTLANVNVEDAMCFIHGSAHSVKAALEREP